MLEDEITNILTCDIATVHELSTHPVQQVLHLSKGHVHCARSVTTPTQQNLAVTGAFPDIIFTAEQEKNFACLQISLNKQLVARQLAPMRLLHLSPRMLLDPAGTGGTSIANDSQAYDETSSLPIKAGKRKPRKKNRKTGTLLPSGHVDQLEVANASESAVESFLENGANYSIPQSKGSTGDTPNALLPVQNGSSAVLPVGANQPDTAPPRALFEEVRRDTSLILPAHLSVPANLLSSALRTAEAGNGTRAVSQLCAAYEDLLLTQREKYEELQQSLNLRLFIAQTEVEALREKLDAGSGTVAGTKGQIG